MGTVIEGKLFKELLCKNDDCLKVLAQIRKIDEQPGLILRIKCERCAFVSEWRLGYSEMEEQFDKLKEKFTSGNEKGGEQI